MDLKSRKSLQNGNNRMAVVIKKKNDAHIYCVPCLLILIYCKKSNKKKIIVLPRLYQILRVDGKSL